ncbi:hypothetical protein F0562_024663 [Nyssa sinensis]|uniref:non-specific serine/threonine protein kinase n=1 Tax=Nyssa sinensis TaxID=561372 RepID=A0A5J5BCJ5_9ASTE|nr:hypothetical protein F0562_024663 [Nyssa sinensis]
MATKGRMVLILHLLCYFSFISPSFSVTDTILQGQQLRDWDQLNSANKVFNLKFFSPGTTKNRYLGIFYNANPYEEIFLSNGKALWVANRDSPIPDASGSLIVDIDGNLKITHISGGPIALNSVPAKRNASATLLDSGNLVLRELNADGSTGQVLWQSFDYPTDTLLPGMKLGINFKTGHIWSITSWISDEAPASGSFTLGGDPNGTSQLIIWWRGDVYWTSGLWSNGYFEFAPQMLKTDYYNFSYVSNENEESFTYLVTEDHIFPSYTITSYGWINERGATEDFSLCLTRYGRGPPPGCAKQKQPECRNLDDCKEEVDVVDVANHCGRSFTHSPIMLLVLFYKKKTQSEREDQSSPKDAII